MPYTNRYEHSYGISILDDIHNLFPEILYDPARFQQNSLVQYVRDRTSELFDVEFARNRAYYRLYIQPRSATPPPRTRATSPPPLPPRPTRHTYTIPITVPLSSSSDLQEAMNILGGHGTIPIVSNDVAIQETLNLFTSAIMRGVEGGLQGVQASVDLQDLLTPVPIVPTSEQIATASILSSLEPPADAVCSICQDHVPPNGTHEWRILRSCSHRFHKQCIDTWFQRNVHCPVCRHDIRVLNADHR